MSIFKDCDIRGIYGKEITAADTYLIGRGMGAMVPPGATVRVGGDVRLSTPELKESLICGLTESGVKVEDLGTIPTPALYYALANGKGGIQLTTSLANIRGQCLYEGMGFRRLGIHGESGEWYYLFRYGENG